MAPTLDEAAMSTPSEPPIEEPSAEGDPVAPSRSSPRRRVRAKRRAAPPLRLIESGEVGDPASEALDLSRGGPLAFMHLGSQDLNAGMRAIAGGARPTAVITGLGETRSTTSRARRLCADARVPWLTDPLLYRTALEGYRTPSSLQDLDYTPGRDGNPYLVEEFDAADLTNMVGRSVVGTQVDVQANALIGGAFVVSGIDDPWLEVNQRLLRIGADAAAVYGMPFIAALPIRMSGFESLESQRLLVHTLMARRPDAWLLMADGLSADNGVKRITSGLRLALALQTASAPVILARSGDLRRLAWSIGIAGAEFGLGRMLRFSVPDYRKSQRGPGPTPGPRMEMGSLGCSLPFVQAQRLVGAELVREAECVCGGCDGAVTLEERMARVAEHNAHTVIAEAAAMTSGAPAGRIEELERLLDGAMRRSRWLDRDQPKPVVGPRIDHQRRALQAAVQAGLLDPARVAEELRLFN